MKKIELYYSKETDCIQMVENDVLKYHDEGIGSVEFLSYFGENIESVDDLKNVSISDILEGYNCILADFKDYSGEDEVGKYFDNVKKQKIQGELIYNDILG